LLGQAHCGTSYTYAQSYQYQYPSYHYGYAQTYQAPAYQAPAYNYNYQKPYHDVIQFVAVEDPYEAALVGAQKRAELKAAAKLRPEVELTATVTKLADAVARLEQRVAAPPYAPPAAYPGPAPSPQGVPSPQANPEPPPLPSKGQPFAAPEPPYAPTKTPPPNAIPPQSPQSQPPPNPEPVGTGGGRRLNDRALQVLSVNCAKCHTGASAKKGFRIFEDGGAAAALGPKELLKIDLVTHAGTMPPKGPLDENAYSDLRAGLGEFGPEIMAFLKQAETQR
jgi:hypothetical protein